jgi:hypothetical protein
MITYAWKQYLLKTVLQHFDATYASVRIRVSNFASKTYTTQCHSFYKTTFPVRVVHITENVTT